MKEEERRRNSLPRSPPRFLSKRLHPNTPSQPLKTPILFSSLAHRKNEAEEFSLSNTKNDPQVFKNEISVIKHQINHELKRHDDEDDPNALNPSSTPGDAQSTSSGGAGVIPPDLKTLIAEEDTLVPRGASIPIWTPV
ncbi:unnamed protein product [Lactuca saligna]|uniref:Uncharacterized protein n=1 Tax=Lactuca saligna TaxID=75948 RepID=A0AA35YGT7_LACSI|nr:unnamed protein product [Lactuca saligna]